MSYFTNIAVQNVNKGFVYITDLTWSLTRVNYYMTNKVYEKVYTRFLRICVGSFQYPGWEGGGGG
jgi:hypothetical protein